MREELVQQWVHDPAAWSRRGDKIVFRSEDIHGTSAKQRRDVPDYLYGSGTKGKLVDALREAGGLEDLVEELDEVVREIKKVEA